MRVTSSSGRTNVEGNVRAVSRLRRYAVVMSILAVAGAGVSVGDAAAAPGPCRDFRIPVALGEGLPADQQVAATLCDPSGSTPEVDILVSGATYNRLYWDWPQNPDLYSYVRKTLEAGRATFTFDRLGTGASTRPDGSSLTVSSDAYILHQLIAWVGRQGYRQINGIGHSLGSVTLTKEAAQWHDLARVVITGILHLPAIGLNGVGFATSLYPAALDPRFAGIHDPAYITTMPGRRGLDFYDPATADPSVVAYDEAHKDLATLGELEQAIMELETPAVLNTTRKITAPVLIVMGQTDQIFCNLLVDCHSADSLRTHESPYYSGAASFTALTVPHTAHNLTLQTTSAESFQGIDTWLRANR